MNLAASFPMQARIAVSPYARRLAHELTVSLGDLAGSGPDGRIVAADVVAHPITDVEDHPKRLTAPLPASVITFSAAVSLVAFCRLATDAARTGLDIAIEDVASRAARIALAGVAGGIALEADGRQIMVSISTGLSIGAERRLRLEGLTMGADASDRPAAASLLVLHSARVVAVALPLLPGRALRLTLAVDRAGERGNVLFCAEANSMTEAGATAVLEAYCRCFGTAARPLGVMQSGAVVRRAVPSLPCKAMIIV